MALATFEVTLDPTNWTEVLNGSTYLAFDIVEAKRVEIYLNENGVGTPSTSEKGNIVLSWPSSYDFEATGMDAETQKIWARGDCTIRGVRTA